MTLRVVYIFPISHHFRLPFHEKLRIALREKQIQYEVCYSNPFGENLEKKDTVQIPWGRKVPLLKFRNGGLLLQLAFREIVTCDLVIVQQENRLLINYLYQVLGLLHLKRVAFFGHGRNFQAENPNSLSERWKRFWATKVSWWFAYTEGSKSVLSGLGFPESRITVFNNAIDTDALRRFERAISPERLKELRSELDLRGNNVGIYVGGVYREKRIEFLVEALDIVRSTIPDFEFVIVGGGADLAVAQAAAATRPWLKVTGPKFGAEKVELMLLARVFLMPGLVGLAVLDAYSVGLPVVTTNYPYHSPEIAYVIDGVTGAVSTPWTSADSYAAAVVTMLRNDNLEEISSRCREQAQKLSIDGMVAEFAKGVERALGREGRDSRECRQDRGNRVV
ncbi:glycosyltransferase [Bradyrhizobium sp. 24]|uniref:glycosyltransferase family 4 protein n=1 Tax=unclassified Bradyrhizobium TaxID=2631580 RepID=UPI001FF8F050|nr:MULTISPECIES: glycosyltransferase [unclassified Bradyrhizobium]MCK1297320.1 glycosyltransferase [Bradyrhizobium sp. 37]MCK1378016.1 glycosyltransferase [Bradyrhizobium sp. 24]MCK1769326.1 glycosyltransferase [Bradyrhizobium sp. 134]